MFAMFGVPHSGQRPLTLPNRLYPHASQDGYAFSRDRLYLTTAIRARGRQPLKTGDDGAIEPAHDDSSFRWEVLCLDKRTGKVLRQNAACDGRRSGRASAYPATLALRRLWGMIATLAEGRVTPNADMRCSRLGFSAQSSFGFLSSGLPWPNARTLRRSIFAPL